MKRKRRARVDHAEPSAASIARLSGLSISRVYRLRQEGKSDTEIIATTTQRKQALALRALPATPVNGHANGVLTLSGAQTAKETWAAKLKELEYQERSGALVPVSYIKFWGVGFIVATKDEMLKALEMADQLASESDPVQVRVILETWIARVCDRISRLENLWSPTPVGSSRVDLQACKLEYSIVSPK